MFVLLVIHIIVLCQIEYVERKCIGREHFDLTTVSLDVLNVTRFITGDPDFIAKQVNMAALAHFYLGYAGSRTTLTTTYETIRLKHFSFLSTHVLKS